MTLAAGSKLGPYEILESIGSGGMGEVWKARDTRLGRMVAIKKVKEQHSERFKQEARSIAALNHPNICQIFDIGDDYLVLEYVDGKALSSPTPEQEAVKLAIQIVTALEAAHKKGIIHRDLKPSNIMVSDEGTVKLLDFGLAKLYEQDQSTSNLPTEEFPATQAGAILGTVAYMSPEQAQGEPADVRSDIFSFGLVLYEMLSGQRAFSGDSTPETMASLLRDEPAPLKTSPALEKIVKRCLEKKPSDRFQRMSELKVELVKATAKKVEVGSGKPQPSIAVLPFADMSPGKDNEWFSDGLAEEIINALTKIPGLKVIARTSSFSFRAKDVDIGQIRDKLKVQNILEGSVRKSGNRIRVTVQLINTADESHLWSERYDRDLTDVFAIQDEISQVISEKLTVQLSGSKTPVKKPTENIEAYNLNLKGRYYLSKLTPDNLAKSKEYFEQAIATDPDYASPWHGLAAMYNVSGMMGDTPPRAANEQSRRAILKALELDNTLPEAHSHLGGLLANEFDWKGAESRMLRALELGPNSSHVWSIYSLYYLLPTGRLEEALAAMLKTLELDPLSPASHAFLGSIYIMMRQYDRAIEQYRNALELNPHWPVALSSLGSAHIVKGELEEGIRLYETNKSLLDRIPLFHGNLGYAYAVAGRTAEAHRILEKLHSIARKDYVPAKNFAEIYLGLGETDKALDWLYKAVDEGHGMISYIHQSPEWDPLRSHPRYKALRRKMNLEP
jgi:serine/threonine protein kinase/Flp pilus assembly protein TadD